MRVELYSYMYCRNQNMKYSGFQTSAKFEEFWEDKWCSKNDTCRNLSIVNQFINSLIIFMF